MLDQFAWETEPFEFESSSDEAFESWETEFADEEWSEEARRWRATRPIRSQRPVPRTPRTSRQPPKPIGRLPRRRWPIGYRSVVTVAPAAGLQSSEYTRWVQSTLNQVLGLQLPINGVLDVQTRSAIRSFQAQQGLPTDGIVGPPTEAALIAANQAQPPQVQDTAAELEFSEFEADGSAWEGEVNRSSCDYIKWVQRALNQIMGLKLAVDGISGTYTRSAIRRFQQQRGLTVDGIVGPQTEQALISAGAGNPPGAGTPSHAPPSSQPSTSSRVQLAKQVLNHNKISLWPYSPTDTTSSDGADARSNVSDTASSQAATRSNYGNAPGGSVNLDARMLDGMLKLANTYDIQITSIAGGSHSSTSRHYAGIAFDINEINGVHVTSSNPYYRALMQKCRDSGATEVLGPGDAGHDTHVHCAWPRP